MAPPSPADLPDLAPSAGEVVGTAAPKIRGLRPRRTKGPTMPKAHLPSTQPEEGPPTRPPVHAEVGSTQTAGASSATIGPTPPATAGPPERGLAGYEIISELGRGAMGVVYRARQVALERDVAVKFLLSGARAAESERRRFLSEAAVLASIQHPGVVQVF